MPAAANLTNVMPKTGEAAPATNPGTAELFAALVAGVVAAPQPTGEAPSSEEASDTGPTLEPEADDGAALIDAAVLLPLIEQQRAAITEQAPSASKAPRPDAIGKTAAAPDTAPKAIPTSVGEVAQPQAALSGSPVEQSLPVDAAPAGTHAEKAPSPKLHSTPNTSDANASDTPVSASQPAGGTAVTPSSLTSSGTAPRPQAVKDPVQPSSTEAPSAPAQGAVKAKVPAPAAAVARAVSELGQPAAAAEIGAASVQSAGQGAPKRSAPNTAPSPPLQQVAAQQSVAPQTKSPGTPREIGKTVAVPTDDGIKAEALITITAAPTAERPAPLTSSSPAPAAATQAPASVPIANLSTAISEQVLDMSRGGAWIDELARDISKAASSDGTMRFRLAPETLGELRVEITQSDRGAHVRLQVTSEAAQQAFAEAQPKLAAEARAQGVRIAETEISFTGGQADGREAGRQAQPDQPLRAFRPGGSASRAPNSETGEPSARHHQDRYA
jgi:hypothetical protein